MGSREHVTVEDIMTRKSKLLATAIVATVMGMGSPASADWEQPLYVYMHFDGSGQVGESQDECRTSGVVNVWQWGYGTNDIQTIHTANCRDGQVVPID